MGLADTIKRAVGVDTADTSPSGDTSDNRNASQDLEDLKARLAGRAKRAKIPRPTRPVSSADANALAELLSPKSLERLVSMPFDTAFAITSYEGWQLDDDERAVLSTSWAITCQYLLPTMNPGLIALAVASINTLMITSKKAWLYRQARAEALERELSRNGPT